MVFTIDTYCFVRFQGRLISAVAFPVCSIFVTRKLRPIASRKRARSEITGATGSLWPNVVITSVVRTGQIRFAPFTLKTKFRPMLPIRRAIGEEAHRSRTEALTGTKVKSPWHKGLCHPPLRTSRACR